MRDLRRLPGTSQDLDRRAGGVAVLRPPGRRAGQGAPQAAGEHAQFDVGRGARPFAARLGELEPGSEPVEQARASRCGLRPEGADRRRSGSQIENLLRRRAAGAVRGSQSAAPPGGPPLSAAAAATPIPCRGRRGPAADRDRSRPGESRRRSALRRCPAPASAARALPRAAVRGRPRRAPPPADRSGPPDRPAPPIHRSRWPRPGSPAPGRSGRCSGDRPARSSARGGCRRPAGGQCPQAAWRTRRLLPPGFRPRNRRPPDPARAGSGARATAATASRQELRAGRSRRRGAKREMRKWEESIIAQLRRKLEAAQARQRSRWRNHQWWLSGSRAP